MIMHQGIDKVQTAVTYVADKVIGL